MHAALLESALADKMLDEVLKKAALTEFCVPDTTNVGCHVTNAFNQIAKLIHARGDLKTTRRFCPLARRL